VVDFEGYVAKLVLLVPLSCKIESFIGLLILFIETNSKEEDMSGLVEEFLKGTQKSEFFEDKSTEPSESIIEMFMSTSFNNDFMSREEAIKAAKKLPSKLKEQVYGKNSRLYFHASDKPYNSIKETTQRSSGEQLCFFANNPEAALAVANVRHNWNYDFCFLHVCKLKSPVNLFNPQCKTDFKKTSFTQKEIDFIREVFRKYDIPERFWRVYENKTIPSTIKKSGFDGIALNFWDYEYPTPEREETEGIAIFNGNQMHVCGIKAVGLKDEIKDRDEYLKDLKIKEELEVEFEAFLKTV